MDIHVSFPGGKRVIASFGSFAVPTDQPIASGGAGSAPSPFDLFLASIGTCAGFYVLAFCQARGIPTDGIGLLQRSEADPKTGRLVRLHVDVNLPPSFPAEHRDAVVRAASACKVKKTLAAPPEITVTARISTTDPAAAAE